MVRQLSSELISIQLRHPCRQQWRHHCLWPVSPGISVLVVRPWMVNNRISHYRCHHRRQCHRRLVLKRHLLVKILWITLFNAQIANLLNEWLKGIRLVLILKSLLWRHMRSSPWWRHLISRWLQHKMKWIKRLTDKSWIPEEDVRKQAQKAMKGTEQMNSFQIICKINEQILVSLVEWAKGKRFITYWLLFDHTWPVMTSLWPVSDLFLRNLKIVKRIIIFSRHEYKRSNESSSWDLVWTGSSWSYLSTSLVLKSRKYFVGIWWICIQ